MDPLSQISVSTIDEVDAELDRRIIDGDDYHHTPEWEAAVRRFGRRMREKLQALRDKGPYMPSPEQCAEVMRILEAGRDRIASKGHTLPASTHVC